MAVTTMRSSTREHSHHSLLSAARFVQCPLHSTLPPFPTPCPPAVPGCPHTDTKRFSSSSFELGRAAGTHLWPFAIWQWRVREGFFFFFLGRERQRVLCGRNRGIQRALSTRCEQAACRQRMCCNLCRKKEEEEGERGREREDNSRK